MDKCNELIHQNINRLISNSPFSENDIIDALSKHLPKNEVYDFFNCKTGCNDRLLIAISKYFKKNINYFVEEHSDIDIAGNTKLEIVLKLKNILNINTIEMSENIDDILLDLTKQALKKELISISYASYILSKPVSEIMELDIE